VVLGWNENLLGLNPGLRTPQLPTTHAEAGTGHRALTWDYTIDTSRPPLAIHLTRATSCRTADFVPFLAFDVEIRKIICTTDEIVNALLGRGLLWDPFSCSPAAQPDRAGSQPGTGWSARSAARTNDLDPGEDRRSVRRRWAWSDPVAKSRVWGCQPCRAALPGEGLDSRVPLVAATPTPEPTPERVALVFCPFVRIVGRVGCQAATMVR
jgi:hypothetical protein